MKAEESLTEQIETALRAKLTVLGVSPNEYSNVRCVVNHDGSQFYCLNGNKIMTVSEPELKIYSNENDFVSNRVRIQAFQNIMFHDT